MAEAYFYHVTRQSVEQALAQLLEKALGAGWRIELRGRSEARLDTLDQSLWEAGPTQFLAHGRAGGADDPRHPILLTTQPSRDGRDCLMLFDSAAFTADEVKAFERVCIVFDGNDDAELHAARASWKILRDAELPAQYWSQEAGRWEKKM